MLDGLAAGGAHSTLGGPWGRPRSCPTQEDPSARRGPVLERQEADAGARGDPPARTRHRLWVWSAGLFGGGFTPAVPRPRHERLRRLPSWHLGEQGG